jgi:hypothetical protein
MVSTGPALRDEGSNGDSVWLELVFLTFGNGVGVLRAFSLLGGWHWARCQGSRSSGDQVGRIWPLVAFWALAFLWRRGFLEREIRVVVRWRGFVEREIRAIGWPTLGATVGWSWSFGEGVFGESVSGETLPCGYLSFRILAW